MQDFRAKIQVKIIMIIITIIIINTINFRFCMITAAILVSQNNKTAAMLMHQKKKKIWFILLSYVNINLL